MGSDSSKVDGVVGRADLLMVDPDRVTFIEDENHPRYDPRVKLPPDEGMILSIIKFGVIEPIVVRKNGTTLDLVAGRRRLRAAREAKRRIAAEGGPELRIKATLERGTDLHVAMVAGVENYHRQDENPMMKAGRMAKLIAMGATDADLQIVFGLSRPGVANIKKLLDLDESVQKAVEHEKLPASIAIGLVDLPREEQAEKAKEMIEAGVTSGMAAKAHVEKIKAEKAGKGASGTPEAVPRMRTRKAIETFCAQLKARDTQNAALVRAALKWALGDDRALRGQPEWLKDCLPE